jgi:molybdate transport system ATP-binding protein
LSASSDHALDVRLVKRVHPRLKLDVALRLGRERGVVFGRSGAGKTTLLRLIAGLDAPDGGFVRLGGTMLLDVVCGINRPLRARRIGMVFQDDLLFPHLSVASNIGFGLRGMPRDKVEERVATVAALCGVEGLLDRRPTTLSGGERQRVGLARALAPRPRLLLCDEPVSALDLASRHALVDRLRVVQAAEAIPLLYVTHSPAEAIALGDRLFLLDGGRVVGDGPPLEVLAASGSSPHLEGVRNVFAAVVEDHSPGEGESRLRLNEGPSLVVPHQDWPSGTAVTVAVLAEEILLAKGPVAGLSARNVIAGSVETIVPHGTEAEVIVKTGGLAWIASVVAPAVAALDLKPGAEVHMIIKARSCQVRGAS